MKFVKLKPALILSLAVFMFSCQQKSGNSSSSLSYFSYPETGQVLKANSTVDLKINFSDPLVDSV